MIKPWPDSPPPQALLGACWVTCSFIRHLDSPVPALGKFSATLQFYSNSSLFLSSEGLQSASSFPSSCPASPALPRRVSLAFMVRSPTLSSWS